jgi:hypothetical protein
VPKFPAAIAGNCREFFARFAGSFLEVRSEIFLRIWQAGAPSALTGW